MAHPTITRKVLLFSAGTALWSALLTMFLSTPLSFLEERATQMKYGLRGDFEPDTNVVVVYIDGEATRTLGWPMRRNFHALMIAALHEMGAGAVGPEILFEERSAEYPEYDTLLASIIRTAGNVVLPGYFRRVEPVDDQWTGEEFRGPFDTLTQVAAGIGHLNVVDGPWIPPGIQAGQGQVRAFALEMLRVSGKSGAEDEPSENSELNYPGRISSFRTYPFVEILRSYDALRIGEKPRIPVNLLAGKLVLIGVVADGRSTFLSTPVDPRYPSIGVHAVLVENILHSRLLTKPSGWQLFFASLVLAYLCAGAIVAQPVRRPGLLVAGMLVVSLVAIQLLFVACIQVHVVPILGAALLATSAAAWYKRLETHSRIRNLETEQEEVLTRLHDREEKVKALEQELAVAKKHQSEGSRIGELQAEIRRYKEEINSLSSRADDLVPSAVPASDLRPVGFDGIIGSADGPTKTIVGLISKIAPSDAPVLILGESGTGKELVARALHKRSNRSSGPFIAVNCGALSETLLESELFGHEKGSFTGAVKDRAGRFELANGGTIFLDEIGDVSEGFQVKLLRVLQEGEFERVGGNETRRVDVRVLAATNRDLKQRIADRKFREDLYYRLNVLSVELSPLRERREDIPILVNHFLGREDARLQISRNVLAAFNAYPWPGNIRELESVVKRGALLAKAEGRDIITLKDLGDELRSTADAGGDLHEQILQSMREKGFSRSSVTETADELGGLSRGTVAEYLRGRFLEAFVENRFDIQKTILVLSESTDEKTNDRVRKRVEEYLQNIAGAVDKEKPWDEILPLLKPKMKNLPQKYHSRVEEIAEGFYRGLWKL